MKIKTAKSSKYSINITIRRRIFLIVILVISCVVLTYEFYIKYSTPHNPNRGKFKPLWDMAIQKMSEGKINEAQKYFKMSDEVRLTDPDFWILSGWENFKQGKYDEAIRRFDRSVFLYNENYEPYFGMGKAIIFKTLATSVLDIEQLNRAEYVLRISMTLNRDPIVNKSYFFYEILYCLKSVAREAHSNQAIQFFLSAERLAIDQKYDLAIGDYKNAIKINPRFSQAYQGLGSTYYSKKDYSLAYFNFEKAIEINPRNAQFYRYMADVYMARHDIDNGIKFYKKSMDTDPVYGNTVINMKDLIQIRERVRLPAVPL